MVTFEWWFFFWSHNAAIKFSLRIYYFFHIHARVICMFEECLVPFTPFFFSQSSSSSWSLWWLSSKADSGSVAHQCCRAQVYFFLCPVYIIKAITWFLYGNINATYDSYQDELLNNSLMSLSRSSKCTWIFEPLTE